MIQSSSCTMSAIKMSLLFYLLSHQNTHPCHIVYPFDEYHLKKGIMASFHYLTSISGTVMEVDKRQEIILSYQSARLLAVYQFGFSRIKEEGEVAGKMFLSCFSSSLFLFPSSFQSLASQYHKFQFPKLILIYLGTFPTPTHLPSSSLNLILSFFQRLHSVVTHLMTWTLSSTFLGYYFK